MSAEVPKVLEVIECESGKNPPGYVAIGSNGQYVFESRVRNIMYATAMTLSCQGICSENCPMKKFITYASILQRPLQ